MFHDIKYTVAENIGQDSKDIKSKKLEADKEWLNCFKPRSPLDIAAYTAIKSKKTLKLGIENDNKIQKNYINLKGKITYEERLLLIILMKCLQQILLKCKNLVK